MAGSTPRRLVRLAQPRRANAARNAVFVWTPPVSGIDHAEVRSPAPCQARFLPKERGTRSSGGNGPKAVPKEGRQGIGTARKDSPSSTELGAASGTPRAALVR